MDSGTTAAFEFIQRRRRSTSSTCRTLWADRRTEVYKSTTRFTTLILALVRDRPRYQNTTPRIDCPLSSDYRHHWVRNAVFIWDTLRMSFTGDRWRMRCPHPGDPPDDRIGSEQTHQTDPRHALRLSAERAPNSLRLTTISCRAVHLHTTSTDDQVSRAAVGSRDGGVNGDRYPALTFLFLCRRLLGRANEKNHSFLMSTPCPNVFLSFYGKSI